MLHVIPNQPSLQGSVDKFHFVVQEFPRVALYNSIRIVFRLDRGGQVQVDIERLFGFVV